MKQLITKAIAVSAVVRTLKRQVLALTEVETELGRLGLNEESKTLKQIESRLRTEIEFKHSYISRLVSSLPTYDVKEHIVVNFISSNDVREGVIDISRADLDKYYLVLETGRIVPAEEIPEEKRNRQVSGSGGMND